MPLRNRVIPPSAASTMLIFAWPSEQEAEISGAVKNEYAGCQIRFEGAMGMMDAIESIMDAMDYPQAFETSRTFSGAKQTVKRVLPGEKKEYDLPYDEISPPESHTELSVQVRFRQNATWQGIVQWPSNGKSASFISALVLLKLVDDAVLGSGGLWDKADGNPEK